MIKDTVTLDMIAAAWEKARAVEGFDAAIIRKDACGAWIQKDMYSQSGSMYGWGIDLGNGGTGTCFTNNWSQQ